MEQDYSYRNQFVQELVNARVKEARVNLDLAFAEMGHSDPEQARINFFATQNQLSWGNVIYIDKSISPLNVDSVIHIKLCFDAYGNIPDDQVWTAVESEEDYNSLRFNL